MTLSDLRHDNNLERLNIGCQIVAFQRILNSFHTFLEARAVRLEVFSLRYPCYSVENRYTSTSPSTQRQSQLTLSVPQLNFSIEAVRKFHCPSNYRASLNLALFCSHSLSSVRASERSREKERVRSGVPESLPFYDPDALCPLLLLVQLLFFGAIG